MRGDPRTLSRTRRWRTWYWPESGGRNDSRTWSVRSTSRRRCGTRSSRPRSRTPSSSPGRAASARPPIARLLAKALNCAAGADRRALREVRQLHRDRGRERRSTSSRSTAPRTPASTTSASSNENGALPAGVGALQDLHHRRSAHALDGGLQRAAEDARRAAASTSSSSSRRPRCTSCRRRSCRAASATTSSASRCRSCSARLQQIIADEKIEATDAALFDLAREADGSMRDAQSLLDQVIVFAGKKIGEAEVRGRARRRRPLGALSHHRRHPDARSGALPASRRRAAPLRLRGRPVLPRPGPPAPPSHGRRALPAIPRSSPTCRTPRCRRRCGKPALRSADDLQRLFRVAQASTEEVRKSASCRRLVLEMTLVKMATLPDAAPVDQLIARLEAMERRLGGGGGGAAEAGRDPRAPARRVGRRREPASPRPASPAPRRRASRRPRARHSAPPRRRPRRRRRIARWRRARPVAAGQASSRPRRARSASRSISAAAGSSRRATSCCTSGSRTTSRSAPSRIPTASAIAAGARAALLRQRAARRGERRQAAGRGDRDAHGRGGRAPARDQRARASAARAYAPRSTSSAAK